MLRDDRTTTRWGVQQDQQQQRRFYGAREEQRGFGRTQTGTAMGMAGSQSGFRFTALDKQNLSNTATRWRINN